MKAIVESKYGSPDEVPSFPPGRKKGTRKLPKPLTMQDVMHISHSTKVFRSEANVRFEEESGTLAAVEIIGSVRRPVIVPLLRMLFGLGIVVSSYQARPSGSALAERLVLQRRDGGAIDARLSEQAKAAILPVVVAEVRQS
jgi:hypothetical protein